MDIFERDGRRYYKNPNGKEIEVKQCEITYDKKDDSVGYAFLFDDHYHYEGWLIFNGLTQYSTEEIEEQW